jgi:hypothetical protein
MTAHSAMLAKIRDALRPGGRLAIVEASTGKGSRSSREDQVKEHEISPEIVGGRFVRIHLLRELHEGLFEPAVAETGALFLHRARRHTGALLQHREVGAERSACSRTGQQKKMALPESARRAMTRRRTIAEVTSSPEKGSSSTSNSGSSSMAAMSTIRWRMPFE